MGKRIVAVVASLVVWFGAALVAGVVLRWRWPEYVAASADLSFTLPMKITRLSIGAVATIAAGTVAVLIGRSNGTAVAAGAVLLLIFIPEHISLWNKFPVWYHLTFLTSLVPLAVAGGSMVRHSAL